MGPVQMSKEGTQLFVAAVNQRIQAIDTTFGRV